MPVSAPVLWASLTILLCGGIGCAVPANDTAGAASPITTSLPDRTALQSLLDSLRIEAGAPGAILGIFEGDGGDGVVAASGLADRETGRAMTPADPWFIGSATKMYTAAVVLRLAEEGRLSLADPLARFLPDFPEAGRITIHHLLAQTSGLKDFYLYLYLRPNREEMIELVTKEWSEEELIALSGRFGRYFEPGTDWDYSSTNYFLLGVVIERATGTTLVDAYRRYLYQPLGLQATWLHRHEAARGTIPVGYMGKVAAWKHSEMFGDLGPTTRLDQSSVERSAGGLVASASEGASFLRALLGGRLLNASSLSAMRTFRPTPPLGSATAPRPADLPPDGYGLGLVRMVRPGFTLQGHGGLYNGHAAGLWSIVGSDLVIALYFNRGFVDQRAALDRIVPLIAATRPPR